MVNVDKQFNVSEEEDTDEELEEKYANLEVDFDESETEEEDFVPTKIRTEQVYSEDYSEENVEGDFPDEFLLYGTGECGGQVATSRGKSFIQDDIHCDHGEISFQTGLRSGLALK